MVLQAQKLFGDLGIKITTGNHLLGSVIGDIKGCKGFVTKKVQGWINLITVLSDIAVTQPQAAYCAYTKTLQNECTFLQHVTPDCQSLFTDLGQLYACLVKSVLPVTSHCSLQLRLGGLSIRNPVTTAAAHYTASRSACKQLMLLLVLLLSHHTITSAKCILLGKSLTISKESG
uniref:Uncharacterized protein n=1 Tax=Amphimedon queenslandica TaxID=400682 RepID=A0A1X7VS20_AMPQE